MGFALILEYCDNNTICLMNRWVPNGMHGGVRVCETGNKPVTPTRLLGGTSPQCFSAYSPACFKLSAFIWNSSLM